MLSNLPKTLQIWFFSFTYEMLEHFPVAESEENRGKSFFLTLFRGMSNTSGHVWACVNMILILDTCQTRVPSMFISDIWDTDMQTLGDTSFFLVFKYSLIEEAMGPTLVVDLRAMD